MARNGWLGAILGCSIVVGAMPMGDALAQASPARTLEGPAADAAQWRELAPGLALGYFDRLPRASAASDDADPDDDGPDTDIVVLRIDPRRWQLEYASVDDPVDHAANGNLHGRTARQWSRARGFAAVINAGMYATDYRTHIGHVRSAGSTRTARINHYQSVAAFDPRDGRDVAPFRLFDLEDPPADIATIAADYASLVQNLRLIDRGGGNRWRDRGQRWSEAALAEDRDGNVLFVFTARPIGMPEFNRALLALPIGVVAAQHLEGGREAQLYVNAGDIEMELAGVRMLPFAGVDEPVQAWPVPNVLGIRARVASGDAQAPESGDSR